MNQRSAATACGRAGRIDRTKSVSAAGSAEIASRRLTNPTDSRIEYGLATFDPTAAVITTATIDVTARCETTSHFGTPGIRTDQIDRAIRSPTPSSAHTPGH